MLKQLCNDLAAKIADYRNGEIPLLDANHVERWVSQFDKLKWISILKEMNHLINNTYFSEKRVISFLKANSHNQKLVGNDVKSFWQNANILDIQQGGTSQSSMRAILSSILSSQYEINLNNAGSNNGIYIYLDDVCFSGNRVMKDINNWLTKWNNLVIDRLIIITMANYENGTWYAEDKIKNKMKELNKSFKIEWWTCCTLENRKSHINSSDVFWPTSLPTDLYVQKYIGYLTTQGHPPSRNLRQVSNDQQHSELFSNETNRNLLEQEFLLKGCYIRDICTNLPERVRPLGFSYMKTLGFGSTIITYRNCPNTAPLVLWVGDPWYPLFPRRTN